MPEDRIPKTKARTQSPKTEAQKPKPEDRNPQPKIPINLVVGLRLLGFCFWASVFGLRSFDLFQRLKTRARSKSNSQRPKNEAQRPNIKAWRPKIEAQIPKTKARKSKPKDQINMDFGLWPLGGLRSLGFNLQSLGFGLRSLVSRLGTPCFVVLFEYQSGHSTFSIQFGVAA